MREPHTDVMSRFIIREAQLEDDNIMGSANTAEDKRNRSVRNIQGKQHSDVQTGAERRGNSHT